MTSTTEKAQDRIKKLDEAYVKVEKQIKEYGVLASIYSFFKIGPSKEELIAQQEKIDEETVEILKKQIVGDKDPKYWTIEQKQSMAQHQNYRLENESIQVEKQIKEYGFFEKILNSLGIGPSIDDLHAMKQAIEEKIDHNIVTHINDTQARGQSMKSSNTRIARALQSNTGFERSLLVKPTAPTPTQTTHSPAPVRKSSELTDPNTSEQQRQKSMPKVVEDKILETGTSIVYKPLKPSTNGDNSSSRNAILKKPNSESDDQDGYNHQNPKF